MVSDASGVDGDTGGLAGRRRGGTEGRLGVASARVTDRAIEQRGHLKVGGFGCGCGDEVEWGDVWGRSPRWG